MSLLEKRALMPETFSKRAFPFTSPLENDEKTHAEAMTGGREGGARRSRAALETASHCRGMCFSIIF